ncbi:MAG: hypothetical protein OEQ53_02800 [Saprospiraceae bacterium]|nr:hypothetical protein [Saprospiraceae bacterium]
MTSKGGVLVAPLNWGLGHATRSIPIIRALVKAGRRVIICSDGRAKYLLQAEFPENQFEELPSYQIKYPLKQMGLYWLRQIHRLRHAIKAEHRQTEWIVSEYNISTIISDNRYGVYHPSCLNILITHQLRLPIPNFLRYFADSYMHRLINRFDRCWVPDSAHRPGLAGNLTRGSLNVPIYFMGPISRFSKTNATRNGGVLVLLSGPEPHRSQLEEKILTQLEDINLECKMVKGKTEDLYQRQEQPNLIEAGTTALIEELLKESTIVICRTGYSSLMDLYRLRKKAVLIPTPGQPEQLTLAALHKENQNFVIQQEENLNLKIAIDKLQNTEATWPQIKFANLESLIRTI